MKTIPATLVSCLLLLIPACGDDSPPPAVPETSIQEIRSHLDDYDLPAAKTTFSRLEQEWMSQDGTRRSALEPIWDEIVAVEKEVRDKRRAGYERFEGDFVQKSEIERILARRAEEKERQRLAAIERKQQRLREKEQRERERQAEAARKEEEERQAEAARLEEARQAAAARKEKAEQAKAWRKSLIERHEALVAAGLVVELKQSERFIRVDPSLWSLMPRNNKANTVLLYAQLFSDDPKQPAGMKILSGSDDTVFAEYSVWSGEKVYK